MRKGLVVPRYKTLRTVPNRDTRGMDWPGVVDLAVDVVVPDEARRLPVEAGVTDAASQTLHVPRATVDAQQKPIHDDVTAPKTQLAFVLWK